jgi:TldD protein
MHRREFVQLGVAAGAVSLSQLTGCASAPSAARAPATAAGSREGVTYFSRFGVDEAMLRAGIAAAMSRGADYADLFFEHRVESNIGLEDGAVNRAYNSVTLGVGVRAVKGDQTGYGYTEELTTEAIQKAALTAASIANGPARSAPTAFKVEARLPQRYSLKRGWEDVRVDEKMPLLTRVNEALFRADKRVKRVNARISVS